MRVILLRHGPAERRDARRWPDDARRPLSARGEEKTRAAVAGLARLEPEISTIATSPFVRAEATARRLHEASPGTRWMTQEVLASGAEAAGVLAFLRSRPSDETIVLVGHEPDLGILAGMLLLGRPTAFPLKKAGACALAFSGFPAPGAARLEWFLPPRALRRLARRKDPV